MTRLSRALFLGNLILLAAIIDVIPGEYVQNPCSVNCQWDVLMVSRFAGEFYQALSESHEGNFVCSPLSVDIGMAMVTYGTRNKTRQELESVLHLPANQSEGQAGYRDMINKIVSAEGVEIGLASKLFLSDNFSIKPDYMQVLSAYFRSEISSLNFNNLQNAANVINSWSNETTKSRIKNIISPGELDGVKLMLVDSIYFKGIWKHGFANSLGKHRFYVNGVPETVPMMVTGPNKMNYYTFDSLDATGVELPYAMNPSSENYSCSMYVLRPNKIDGLATIERNLHSVKFNELTSNKTIDVFIFMPGFNITNELNLKPVLQKMGIRDIFESTADFNILSDDLIELSQIKQKATITLNKYGTEASAGNKMSFAGRTFTKRITFTVDRPFLCVIALKSSGTALFYVRITDPRG